MSIYKQKIKYLAEYFYPQAVQIRRYLHQNPELSGQEQKTAQYICEQLQQIGISSKKMLDDTAVIAYIKGNAAESTKTIALRADMDALPITETNTFDFVSKHEGVMHACGHDVHMANLISTAYILNNMKDYFAGTIVLIFQPSEEKFPGGAIRLIEAGVLDNPHVDAVFGCHVSPEIQTGKIGLKCGKYMASTDELYITIKGKGGHAAIPSMFINPLLITSEILLELENFCFKYAPKDIPSVLTFGRIIGNGRTNVVPESVSIEGTLRTFNEDWRKQAYDKLTNICNEIAKKRGGSVEIFIDKGYPVLINDDKLTQECNVWTKDIMGAENVLSLDYRMTAEDFSYYSHYRPSVFFRLGVKMENLETNLHAANFNANEEALKIGATVMSFWAMNFLSKK